MKIARLKSSVHHKELTDLGFEKRYNPKTGEFEKWVYCYALNNEKPWFHADKTKNALILRHDLDLGKYLGRVDLMILLELISLGYVELVNAPESELPF